MHHWLPLLAVELPFVAGAAADDEDGVGTVAAEVGDAFTGAGFAGAGFPAGGDWWRPPRWAYVPIGPAKVKDRAAR